MTHANTEYVLQYCHEGQRWALNFFAIDDADAERKVASLRATLELKGRLLGRGETQDEAAQEAVRGSADQLLRRLGCQI